MTARNELIAKIRRLPEPLIPKATNYVDSLLAKQGGRSIRQSQTLTGIPFQYEGNLAKGMTAYVGEDGSRVVIQSGTIKRVRSAIQENPDGILMGANRTDPKPSSLGAMLQREGIVPQQLCYLIPLLKKAGFCDAVRENKPGRPFLVKFTENV